MARVFTTISNAQFYEVLQEDAAEHETNWTLNRHARVGDAVWLYICAPISAIVATAIVATTPEKCEDPRSEWFGSYFADMHSLVMAPHPLTLGSIRALYPEWRYWKQPRNSIEVPAQYVEQVTQFLMGM